MASTRSSGAPLHPAQAAAEAVADGAVAKSPTASYSSSAPFSPISPTSPASDDVAAFTSDLSSMSVSRDPFMIRDSKKRGPGRPIPRFTVDLSLPPAHRFDHIVPQFRTEIENSNLTGLFDELLNAFVGPKWSPMLHLVAGIALRRVYSSEETEELKGIATATGVPMHLLVAFNVLLDLLLGCTSGGVRVEAPTGSRGSPSQSGTWITRMLHFRTLDWGMDPLRNIVIELNYVRHAGGPVIATSITYFGYVGVLTGVRKGLSMSLNFRPTHDCSTRSKEVRFRLQQFFVVLGVRQSISSVLRRYLLLPEEELELILRDGRRQTSKRMSRKMSTASSDTKMSNRTGDTIKPEIDANIVRGILEELSSSPSTSCYLVFSTPQTVYSVQKDHHAALIRQSDSFLTTYNHDAIDEIVPAASESLVGAETAQKLGATEPMAATAQNLGTAEAQVVTGMETVVSFSCDRKRHLDKVLRKRLDRRRKKHPGRPEVAIGTDDLLAMVKDPWISNEESHYAVIMDPTSGKVLWRRLYDVGDLG
jgi:hypothetical protein